MYFPLSPYKALENFSKALYGTTEGTYSAHVFRPIIACKLESKSCARTPFYRRTQFLSSLIDFATAKTSNRIKDG